MGRPEIGTPRFWLRFLGALVVVLLVLTYVAATFLATREGVVNRFPGPD